jgi:hypothetical protein
MRIGSFTALIVALALSGVRVLLRVTLSIT